MSIKPEELQTPPEGETLVVPKLEAPDPPAPPAVNGDTPPAPGRTFSAEDIERARREEKDKLYSEIGGLKDELKAIKSERQKANEAFEAAAKAEADKAAKAEAEVKKKAEEEMGLRELLTTKEQEWEQRLQQIEAERQTERELLAKERRFTELQKYRIGRLEAVADTIMPELRDLVTHGPDEQTIEASIADLQGRTQRVLDQMTAGQQAARMAQRGSTVTAPPVGPLEQQEEFQNLTPQQIREMDMATYAKNRERLLGAVSNTVRNRGPYGG